MQLYTKLYRLNVESRPSTFLIIKFLIEIKNLIKAEHLAQKNVYHATSACFIITFHASNINIQNLQ